MKPERLWLALNDDGSPRWATGGYYLPLNRTALDAACGWSAGFRRPKVQQVEVRPVKKRKKPKRGY